MYIQWGNEVSRKEERRKKKKKKKKDEEGSMVEARKHANLVR